MRWYINPYRIDTFPENSLQLENRAQDFHTSLPGYSPTPLIELPTLANELGIGRLLVKDESHRFGLNAFKGLGASYATYRLLQNSIREKTGAIPTIKELLDGTVSNVLGDVTLATATDGNHGRAVAWAARLFGCRAVIFIPSYAGKDRIEAIESEGAKVVVVEKGYDAAVDLCAEESEKHGMLLVQDSAWEGYEEIPRWIMEGYLTMFAETDEQLAELPGSPQPDIVFAQAGVGSFAGSVAWHYAGNASRKRPRLVCIEPAGADCLFASITSKNGNLAKLEGELHTLMACLNAGTPSSIAWPVNRAAYDLFLSIDDDWAAEAMRRFYHPFGEDHRIISGESGSAGLAGLLALASSPEAAKAREAIGLGPGSTILLFNTEGDTDPEMFRMIVTAESKKIP